ncbi:MAG TPA: NapC/NirT family cytochrome c [Burkholderiaceae bacterium]|nr:NapC/NirT family cytochrome c [Burkholderiaceae bacterium]
MRKTIDHRARPSGRRWLVAGSLALGIVIGVIAAGTTTWMVNASSSNNFCATECHSMQWAVQAYQRGTHYANESGVRATCADCHIPFEDRPATPFQYVFGTLWTKGIDGSQDVAAKLRGTIADRARWEAEKPRLSAQVRAWFKQTGSATCQGCHKLDAFSGQGASAVMKLEVHSGALKAATADCLQCHPGVAHAYSTPVH